MITKHILVPIDFSNDSISALEYAILLSNQLNYNIRLIHVKRQNADYNASFNFSDFDEVIKSGVRDSFERITKEYSKEAKGIIDYKIREGRIYTEICNQAKYGDAELIIMGTHGVSGFEEHWAGSNAFRVASNASCPVVTIRYNFPLRPIKKILLPIDSSLESRQKVPFVAEMALLYNAELHIIDIRGNNKAQTLKKLNEYMSQVSLYLERRKVKVIRDSIKANNIAESCIEYGLMVDADLIAIMTGQNKRQSNILLAAYAQQMINHSPVPIISFRPQ